MILAAAFAFCVAGYAREHRPSQLYTQTVKTLMLRGRPARLFELDHIVPLELGGSGWSPWNFQLQPWPDARRKDKLENELHQRVCAGELSLSAAQREMREWKP